MPCGGRRPGPGSAAGSATACVDIGADGLLMSACRRAAAGDRLSGDLLVPLSLDRPGRRRVAGMIDGLRRVLAGHRAVERHGVAVRCAGVVAGPGPGVAGTRAGGESGVTREA